MRLDHSEGTGSQLVSGFWPDETYRVTWHPADGWAIYAYASSTRFDGRPYRSPRDDIAEATPRTLAPAFPLEARP